MVTNENNSYINSFNKGMNSDTAFDQIENSQYIFGLNIRITKNQLLGNSGEYSSVHEGIVTPVPSGINITTKGILGNIIAVESIDLIGIIITANGKDMHIYKIKIDETLNICNDYKEIWQATNLWSGDVPGKISTVLYKELENVIKLYIADGEHPIISLRVDDESENNYHNTQNNSWTAVDDLINNRIIPKERVRIDDVISGRLTTSQVQYTYRYYNKYGNTTQLAPLTNKIQVIDPSRSKEIGNAENTESSMGFALSIDMTGYENYQRIQVYRMSYIIPGQDAEISLIYDGETNGSSTFTLNDVGIDPLKKLSIEEFASMSGMILVPLVIEQNQEYMFCANIKDDTILKDVSINGNPPEPQEVTATVVLSDKISGDIPDPGNHKYINEYNSISGADTTVTKYLEQRGINSTIVKASYNDVITSSLLRSLRRGEEYKYALVFYDDKGRRTDVISLPEKTISSYSQSIPFECVDGKLVAHPIGVSIPVPQLNGSDANNIIGCQVIRRSSSDVYQKTLLQVALARPISQALLDVNIESIEDADDSVTKKSPFYPTGFLSVAGIYIYPSYYYRINKDDNEVRARYGGELGFDADLAAVTRNRRLYQIFSSEIDFRRNDVLSRINTSDTTMLEVLYIPSVFAKYTDGIKDQTYNGTLPSSMKIKRPDSNTSTTITEEYAEYKYTYTVNNDYTFSLTPDWVSSNCESIIFTTDDDSMTQVQLTRSSMYDNDHAPSSIPGPVVNLNENIADNSEIIQFIKVAKNMNSDLEAKFDSQYSPSKLTVTVRYTVTGDYDEGYDPTEDTIHINRLNVDKLSPDEKKSRHWIFDFYTDGIFRDPDGNSRYSINQVKDVKIPNWDSAFTQISKDDEEDPITAIKQYKSFTTNIDAYSYNNWVSFAKYDLRAGGESQANMDYSNNFDACEIYTRNGRYQDWINHVEELTDLKQSRYGVRMGYIGPGPSCFLLTTKYNTGTYPIIQDKFYTSICNIQHTAKTSDVLSDEFTQYYGFGNYFPLKRFNGQLKVDDGTATGSDNMIVFDGDIYITPHEFTTMYKAYEFNSIDTLLSTLVTNYIPLESKINTYFDYGMNVANTQSANMIYEPGHIDGITTQDRASHQYNMIYSDNDASNDVFTLISTDKNETNQFKQRAYYSDLKTNGEFIDNFLIFKAASFIDVDSRYGQITDMLTDKNMLYYWQDHACGKFSVNERSLVSDLNSNTIMLGLAGILSRYDYISTRYGMRLHDFCARSTEGGVFWVDINNKAIAAMTESKAVNVGEQFNIQNIINKYITTDIPNVDYDLQNDELLCKCFGEDQVVFNIKYNLWTSVYNRRYDFMLYIKNHLYGLTIDNNRHMLNVAKHNYLSSTDSYISPLALSFVVNPAASITKVFDSLQLVPIKRDAFTSVDHANVLDGTTMSFETDIVNKPYSGDMEPYTDREGNIIYNIPRYVEGDGYGNRTRGKWLRVNIKSTNPTEYLTISHLITKFRQSYS